MKKLLMFAALAFACSAGLIAQDVVSAVEGTVKRVDAATKVVVVKTTDGTEHTFHLADDLAIPVLADRAGMSERSFIRHYTELPQSRGTERSRESNVRRVSTYRHEHAADSRLIVTRIKRPPAVFQVDLEPGTEVHG